ncbi:MAG: helix-turn-helix domain-containing protein [Acidobacteria bacterium]|nr:helix-turn-helix domain-containing protein [Acidobacteriota bacterium]
MGSLQQILLFLVHYLGRSGVTAAAVGSEVGLAPGVLETVEDHALVALVPEVIRAAQELVSDELVVLHAGENFHLCLGGAGGLAATHAPTPGMALETFGRFVHCDHVLTATMSSSTEEATLRASVVPDWPENTKEQVLDGFFAAVVAVLRTVRGSTFVPVEARRSRAEPDDTRSYLRALGPKVVFGCDHDEIVIRNADLVATSVLYDPQLYEQLVFIADLTSADPVCTGPLRQMVEQTVRSGELSLESVAQTLRLSPRTLQRRLRAEGTGFRAILNQVRVDLARDLLVQTDLPIAAIAQRLRYSDDKSLRNALRAFTGMTPTQIRAAGEA